jgi:glycosyltransferase involved in cell wall biosynthesis
VSGSRPRIIVAFGASSRATPAAGPVLSLKGLMAALEREFEFLVLSNPCLGQPNTVEVRLGLAPMMRWLNTTPHDLIYLNSFFDREYSLPILALHKVGLIPRRPILVAPRGELLANALALKSGRKRFFMKTARIFNLYKVVWLHATSNEELRQCRLAFPWLRGIKVAGVAPEVPPEIHPEAHVPQSSEIVRLAFVGRIARVKNLQGCLAALLRVRSKAHLDIYGPIEDAGYWAICQRLLASLPPNAIAVYRGIAEPSQLPVIWSRADLLFLLSRS